MKQSLRHFLTLCLIGCQIFLLRSAIAQTIKSDDTIPGTWAQKSSTIDGKLTDWNDSLQYFNEDTQFSFSIRNDDNAFYLAIKSKDKQNLNRILTRGISFSLNTEGKKKTGATIIFPVLERSSQPAKPVKGQPDIKERQAHILARIQRINVTGFTDILDGPISMNNTYGIEAAASFDSEDNLVVEIAVPLEQLGITTSHRLIALLVEINGIKQPRSAYNPNRSSRNGMYGYPSQDYRYDRGPVTSKLNAATGFWIKTTLAKKQ